MKRKLHIQLLTLALLCLLTGMVRAQTDTGSIDRRLGFGTLHDIAWSPDGSRFAVASAIGVQVYDADLNLIDISTIYESDVRKIAWQPGGTQMAIATGHGILIMNVPPDDYPEQVRDIPPGRAPMAWSPDGKWLALTDSETQIWLRDSATGAMHVGLRKNPLQADPAPYYIEALGWSPDSTQLVTIGYPTLMATWDAATGKILDSYGFTGQGNVPAPQWEGSTLKVMDVAYGITDVTFEPGKEAVWRSPEAFSSPPVVAAYSPDAKWLVDYAADYSIHLRDIETLNPVATVYPGGYAFYEGELEANGVVAWRPDGKTVLVGMTGSLYRLRVGDGTLTLDGAITGGYMGAVNELAWSPDSTQLASVHGNLENRLSSGDENRLRVWDVSTGKLVWRTDGNDATMISAAWRPDGQAIAAGYIVNGVNLRIFASADGTLLAESPEESLSAMSIHWLPGGNDLITSSDGYINSYTVTDKVVSFAENFQPYGAGPFDVSPDGSVIASRSSGEVTLWRIKDGAPVVTLEDSSATGPDWGDGCCLTVAYSPDGKSIAVSDGSVFYNYESDTSMTGIKIYDVATGKIVQAMKQYRGGITDLAWSPDSLYLVSTGRDGRARLWDVTKGGELSVLVDEGSTLTSAAWSPDGETIAVGGANGAIYLLYMH